ncbi:MAG: 3-dehydroquinate synthase [Vicinamibacteria bacterium]
MLSYHLLMTATRIEVAAGAGAYPVVIAPTLLKTLPEQLARAGLGPRRFVVTSPLVHSLHGSVGKLGTEREVILIPDGERAKTLATVSRVYEALIRAGADRSAVIVAVGGGVIGDLVGFAATTYLRGVRLVQVPTTLMAQVDSAIGGKVGVNHPLGKNLIGAFHAPSLVAIDPEFLTTLPRREFRAGLYEVIKYGVIADPAIVEDLETHLPAIFARTRDAIARVVTASCRVKAEVVSADERESGFRRTLNFGHTIGHAIEAVTRYRRFRHGEAVAYGMLGALAIGVARGVTPRAVLERIQALIMQLGPLPAVADLSIKELVAAVGRDKKVVAGTLHFVASSGLGTTTTLTDVTPKELRAALKAIGVTRP